jgi:hypothetical protein
MTIPSAARRSCHKRSASMAGPSSAEVVMPNRSIGGRTPGKPAAFPGRVTPHAPGSPSDRASRSLLP